MKIERVFILVAAVLVLTVVGLADIPRPDRTPSPKKQAKSVDTTMEILLDGEAKEARLIIPKSQVSKLRAALDEMDGGGEPMAVASTSSRTQTIVSGLFLSLALVVGGVWFVRSGKVSSTAAKTAIVLAVTAGLLSTASLVYGDIAPPTEARSITGKMFSQYVHELKQGSGKIKLEVSSTARSVQLIVPDGPETTR